MYSRPGKLRGAGGDRGQAMLEAIVTTLLFVVFVALIYGSDET